LVALAAFAALSLASRLSTVPERLATPFYTSTSMRCDATPPSRIKFTSIANRILRSLISLACRAKTELTKSNAMKNAANTVLPGCLTITVVLLGLMKTPPPLY
jgi:hypothetical protein